MRQRIVIYRLGSLGDTVMALPCFHKIAQVFGDAERIVLTNFPVSSKAAPLQAVLGSSGLVHGAIAYPIGTRAPAQLWSLMRRLRALEADTMIYLTGPRGLKSAWRDKVFFSLCGFRRIIGIPDTPDRQAWQVEADGLLERECNRMARCLAELGPIDLADRHNWDLRLDQSEWAAGRTMTAGFDGARYIAINMGGKAAENDWGVANWKSLLSRLGRLFPALGLLVVGGPEDSARAEMLRAFWPGPLIDACGKLSPRESGAAMADAQLFIGHDSGPMHLAGAMGTACVGLLGGRDPAKIWHPPGPQHHIIHEDRGVAAISVDRVLDIACAKLA